MIYWHEDFHHVHYCCDGKMVEHGRVIYKEVPKEGDIVSPFPGCSMKVIRTEICNSILVIHYE